MFSIYLFYVYTIFKENAMWKTIADSNCYYNDRHALLDAADEIIPNCIFLLCLHACIYVFTSH